MRKIVALLAAVPLVAVAQGSAPETHAPPPASEPAPAPQYAPPPPQYAAPPQYAPPAPPAVPVQHQPRPKQRGSWYIGFGLGSGDGRVSFDDGTDASFKDMVYPGRDTVSFNLRVGGTLSPRLLLGFDGGFIAASAEEQGFSSSVQLNYYDVGIMYFPSERGFFLRAATGLSSVVQELESPIVDIDASARGFNVLGGIGYAFWLGRAFNLTLNVDAQRHMFSNEGVDGATSWSAWLGFDWY